LIEEEITLFHWVPTPFRHFIATLTDADDFPELRLIVLGSETLIAKDVELYKKQFAPDCHLVNRFGTTETGNIRWYFIDKDTQISGAAAPVGYALEDTEVLLFDNDGKEAGFNEVGEISVKSRYLSPGDWLRQEPAAGTFLAEPKGGGARLYRTGDLGVMLDDGCLARIIHG
jgi:non-ribosomal peptide synthetase component F